MEATEIRAVEMTRRIRAENAERLRGATPEERIQYYRDKANRLKEELSALRRSSTASISSQDKG